MNIFNADTTVGKAVKTLIWAVGSAGLVALLTTITSRPDMFSPQTVVLANVFLVAAKNVLDPEVSNF